MNRSTHLSFPAELWLPFAESRAPVICAPGYLIYHQNTVATCFYYLKRGKVKSFTCSEDGNERILRNYQQGDIFGVASFFDEMPRVSSAIAVNQCEVVPIDRMLVTSEFSRDPALAMTMIQYLSRAVRLLSDQVDEMAFRPAPQRVARYLLSLSHREGEITCTQEEVSSAISASRVTVSRILSSFSKSDWIRTGYGTMCIIDRPALTHFVRE